MGKRWREKNDRFIHDGDCRFWSLDICTCGLLHHLMPNSPDGDYGDWFWEERARHENQMNRVPKPLSYVKPTKEELAERQKLLDEVFPDNEINLEDD